MLYTVFYKGDCMKKLYRIGIEIVSVAIMFFTLSLLFSCTQKNKTENQVQHEQNNSIQKNLVATEIEPSANASDFFTLDFTPMIPESTFQSNVATNNAPKIQDKTLAFKDEPLPNLNTFSTAYFEKRDVTLTTPNLLPSQETITKPDNAPFTVVDYGPRGEIPAITKNPTFYVIFSEPVHEIMALEKPTDQNPLMSIEPPLKGVFRWYGSYYLAFEAHENIQANTDYTIKIADNTRSLLGKSISGEKIFSIHTEPLKILSFYPGFTQQDKSYLYINKKDVPLTAANKVLLEFNYDVDATTLEPFLYASAKDFFRFSLQQIEPNKVLMTIKDKIVANIRITAGISTHANAGTNYNVQWYTLRPLRLDGSYTSATHGAKGSPVHFYFNHAIDETTILESISTTPEMPITAKNIDLSGDFLTLHSLPLKDIKTYTVFFKTSLKDVYGQNLKSQDSKKIYVSSKRKYFSEYGNTNYIVEAEFSPRFVFEYQDVAAGSTVSVINDKKYWLQYNSKWAKEGDIFTLTPNPKRQFLDIDLNPYLKKGKGYVRLGHNVKFTNFNQGLTTVQVTDLGATVSYALNKAVVLVSSLKTGEPIKDAKVYVMDGKAEINNYSLLKAFKSTTDENGFAVIDFDYEKAAHFFQNLEDGLLFYIKTADDEMFFVPNNRWKTARMYQAFNAQQTTFLFCDRGVYKPGETITFKGIDKDLRVSTFSSYTGEYVVSVKELGLKENVLMEQWGSTSTTGSFDGSFNLQGLKPGVYNLTYRRIDSEDVQRMPFTVAYFERLKFQASLKMPPIKMMSGDTINAELSASYLGGGSVFGATYTGRWFERVTRFKPKNKKMSDYTFGPILRDYYSFKNLSDFEGTLSATGTAIVNYKSESPEFAGATREFLADVSVTDISNQLVATRNGFIVHPANYYIGVARAPGFKGFGKKDENVSFMYALTDISGNELTESQLPSHKKLRVRVQHNTWRKVQQRGATGAIYISYEEEVETELDKQYDLNVNGTIDFTPKSTGMYTLIFESIDSQNRVVRTDAEIYVTGSQYSYSRQDEGTSLTLTANQSMYNPGDTAELFLESPLPKGTYLLTVEREGIFSEKVFTIQENTHIIKVPIAVNYVPFVDVSIRSFSPRTGQPVHKYGEEDIHKPRAYRGFKRLQVDPYVKAFSVSVEFSKQSYRPGEKVGVLIKAHKQGKPVPNAELTLLAVDRGVLDLIDYHVPNPIDFFYNDYNFSNQVVDADSRSFLMDPVTYEVKSLQGGDSADSDKENERKDFNPTALFVPTLITDEKGEVRTEFTLPDNLTTYRFTTFGAKDDLFAFQEDELAVQNPLNVSSVLPRRMRERDTAECGVLLTNLQDKDVTVTVSIATRAPEERINEHGFELPVATVNIEGTNEKTVTVPKGQSFPVYFYASAQKQGKIDFVFSIKSDVLTEKLVSPLIIEKPYLFETFTTASLLRQDQNSREERIVIPSFADDNQGNLSVSISANQLGALKDSVRYLFDYPHGCLEQQSGRVLPLVIFDNYIKPLGFETKVKNIPAVINQSLSKWAAVQQINGGFPYWESGTESNDYVTARIAHIYALAKKKGFVKSDTQKIFDETALLNYVKTRIVLHDSDYLVAYGNYILSLFDENLDYSDRGKIEFLEDSKDISVLSYMGLSFLRTGNSEKASAYAEKVRSFITMTARGVHMTLPAETHDYWFAHIKNEGLALALQLFVEVNPDDVIVPKLIHTLLEIQRSGYWNNTVLTARVLEAFKSVIQKQNLEATDFFANITLTKTPLVEGQFQGLDTKQVTSLINFIEKPLDSLTKDTAYPLVISKKGEGRLYYVLSLKYAIPMEMQQSRDEGLEITYNIIDRETNQSVIPDSENSAIIHLKKGKIYRMNIQLSSGFDRTYLALRAPIPSGGQIIDANFVTSPNLTETDNSDDDDWWDYRQISYQQIYDNEVDFFWNFYQAGSKELDFMFRAGARGAYPCPPVTAECMYETEIFGRSSGFLYIIE